MANKEDHPPPPPPRGNEWEVVSLTSSAYAASPGPYNVDSRDAARKFDHAYYGGDTSRDLFMSDHFVFPPSQHEDLPLDDDDDEFDISIVVNKANVLPLFKIFPTRFGFPPI